MSAKPTTLPVWATDANYTGGPEAGTPTKVTPIVSRQAEGWEPAAKPPAQNFNWWQNLVYLWAFFINSLFDSAERTSMEPPVGGNVILSGDLLPLWYQGGAGPAFIVGDRVRNNGGVVGSDNQYECIVGGVSGLPPGPTGTGSAIIDGAVTWKWIGHGDGAGKLYHGLESMTVGLDEFSTPVVSGNGYANIQFWNLGNNTAITTAPITLPVGSRVRSISHFYQGNSVSDYDVTFYEYTATTLLDIATVTNANPPPGFATFAGDLAPAGNTGYIEAGKAYAVRFEPNAAGVQIGPVTVTYDRPKL